MFIYTALVYTFLIKNHDNLFIQNVNGIAKATLDRQKATNFDVEHKDHKLILVDSFTKLVLDNRAGLKPNDTLFWKRHGGKNQLFDLVSDGRNLKLSINNDLFLKYDSAKEAYITVDDRDKSDNFSLVDAKSNKVYRIEPTLTVKDSFSKKSGQLGDMSNKTIGSSESDDSNNGSAEDNESMVESDHKNSDNNLKKSESKGVNVNIYIRKKKNKHRHPLYEVTKEHGLSEFHTFV